ncbi:MBL fold metallo-hydrolase [Paeniglutamicibacter psychrophenolicus]|uniref:Glyoxylase-like metal-dependent hydrolase (Beta-lactamase superfamily II) n=1 Tax=Paeniglutamicibacter psychrophenolicus TaxID=257454 RepID=A0ABS4WHC8_9MICC|nr:MBL fold metallo-hydrolase [Paeniglutamicibacter psychrophenolicus]MBP2375602.1 glyoxylase-like metal-dependent hydrolase (beta-lactamase superfamily II) [Paeniglutamicibacter psychrophenolicus]
MTLPLITLTGHAQKEAWQLKVLPPVERIGEEIWSIPVPFPNNPMRYTLSYLLLGDGDAVLIDPGWDSETGMEHLAKGMRQAGIGPTDLTGIVATHFHSDHLGMASRLRKSTGAWVALGEKEVRRLTAAENLDLVLRDDREQLAFWGVPADRLAETALDRPSLTHLQNLADPDLRLSQDSLVPAKGLNLRVVTTPGHSPGHICLVDEPHAMIFSGDHVLPRISPHIALELPGPVNPLADYYESLDLIAFEDEMEVCPAHEYRFIGMQRRVAQLIAHNRERSAEVLQVMEAHGPETVWDIALRLTWSRGWESLRDFSLRLALSETASHVVYLRSQGHTIDVPVTDPSWAAIT